MNSSVFEIERSTDGLTWSKAGTVAAKGNSVFATTYSFSEILKGGNTFSYRLKMIDTDNAFEYSSIVKISLNGSNTTASVKTYPNPATDYFAVDGSSNSMNVQVVNMNGAVVKSISNYTANTKVSLNGVVAGNYVVRVSDANGASQAFKMVVNK
jgi:hypothetical protein